MGDDEKKAEDLRVSRGCLSGLLALQRANLLLPENNGDEELCESWPSDKVHFDQDCHVTYLNLGNKRLRKGLDNIDEIFSSFPRLANLNLGGTDLPLSQLREVLDRVGGSLEALFLGGNGYRNEICSVLAEWIQSTTRIGRLIKLDLRYNDIESSGLSELCQYLSSVKYLYLEGNRLDDLEDLAEFLKTPDANLQELYLGANNVGSNGAFQLASCLSTNKKLVKIYLEGNSIGAKGADSFSEALESMEGKASLQHLFVDNNGIGKESSQRLAKALNSATTIGESLFE